MKELIKIQSELKAPKNLYNSFGRYSYRSAETILEAVKPLLKEADCTLILSDDIVMIGDRYYIKVTATLTNKDGKQVSNTAYAREEESKKGQDGSQITGTASSYARKYALNGLFLIDDTKDADTDEYQAQTKQAKPQQAPQRGMITDQAQLAQIAQQALQAIAQIQDAEQIRPYYLSLPRQVQQMQDVIDACTARSNEARSNELKETEK